MNNEVLEKFKQLTDEQKEFILNLIDTISKEKFPEEEPEKHERRNE